MEATAVMGGDARGERKASQFEKQVSAMDVSDEDMLRGNVYGLLARVLAAPMSDETLEMVRSLDGSDDDTELGRALESLGVLAARTPRGKAEDEYTSLFYGAGAGGEMTPYASFYETGFIYERPLAELRKDMIELGIERSGTTVEPEDHIATLCEIMHGLITGAFGPPPSVERQRQFFNRHIANWAGLFFEDLEGAESGVLYMPIGTVGKLFMAVEAEAFEMAA